MYYPHQNIPGSSFYCFANQPNFDMIAGCDIVVVQRCCSQAQYNFINTCRSLGSKIIYDLDDDVWDLPESNPAHVPLTQMREGFVACIQLTDLVTVSTKTLEKRIRANVKPLRNRFTGRDVPVVVAENWMDQRLYATPRKDNRFIIGWSGSSSHIGDLAMTYDALNAVSDERPDALVEFRGCDPSEDMKRIRNFYHKPWVPVAEFSARMPVWGWSIALAPVTDHPFNSAKSGIKMYESAYCKIPCLASWVKPYDDFTSHDPELRWLLCAGQGNWKPKLRELIHDEGRRNDLGQRAYNVLTKHYTFNRVHPGWREAFETVRG
jgi:hypothetical protein